jgi:arylsulfatase A-like enzyme
LYENETEVFVDGYATEIFTAKALEFINSHKDKPFFLNLAYNAPHYSRPGFLQAPPEYIRRFTDSDNPALRDIYRAMTACMDDGIGKIYAGLDELNLLEDTLLVFLSDNGADPKNGGSNGILRGGKWTLWEGGLRIPFIVKLPGRQPQVKAVSQPVHIFDIFPTIVDVCGVGYEGSLDGVSLKECVKDNARLRRRNLYFSYNNQKVVCNEQYKYAVIDGGEYLFDIANDIGETKNIITVRPDIAEQFEKKYMEWQECL